MSRMASIRWAALLLPLSLAYPLRAAERTHADTPQMMLDEGYDLTDPASPYMISIPKMRAGHEGAQFFSIWVPTDWPAEDLIPRAMDLIKVVDEQVAKPSDSLEFA